MFAETNVNLAKVTAANNDPEYKKDVERRLAAEDAATRELYHSREIRAAHTKNRKMRIFTPGDLVYYWRRKAKGHHETAGKGGRFLTSESARYRYEDSHDRRPSTSTTVR